MKRIGYLFEEIYSIENLKLADEKARKGKKNQYGIRLHDKNKEANIQSLHDCLLSGNFKTSAYRKFKVFEPKERLVFKLPYYPDRIVHHAIMNVLEPIMVSSFTSDTYACIKGRGIHAAARSVKKSLLNIEGTQYCLKLDITKFYPSVDHGILKSLFRRKFKDERLLSLLDEIIDSCEDGLPIGNLLSQYASNFYLTPFDKFVKSNLKVKYYFRYADDIVILSDSKEFLHDVFNSIEQYLSVKLKLRVKNNWQIFPVDVRGIDFVGYVFRHRYTRIRKGIKRQFAKMLKRNPNLKSIASYHGWLVHADAKHLTKKLISYEVIQRIKHQTERKHRIKGRKDKNFKSIQ